MSTSVTCRDCLGPVTAREGVFNKALGRESWCCLECLAAQKGNTVAELEAVLLAHVARRECLSEELAAAERDSQKFEERHGFAGDHPRPNPPPSRGWGFSALRASQHEFQSADLGQIRRYSRQLSLPQVGDEGQRRLSRGRVLLIGAGGLGSPTALYLAAAGVGTIAIADADRVELSNLQRQILHASPDVGRAKVESAAERLAALNPHVRIAPLQLRLDASNARDLVGDYDVVIDGSDNLATREALNAACVSLGKPWVHGAVQRFYGHATVFEAGGRPCYRCLFPEDPQTEAAPSCEEAGVLGMVTGVVGTIQALEAIKLLLGAPSALARTLWTWDGWTMETERIGYGPDPGCPVCG